MKKPNKTLDCLYGTMDFYNYHDSFGSIVLKNGIVLQVPNFFEYFNEYWNDYKLAQSNGDTKKVKQIISETGGVLGTDEISIDINDIAATISIYKLIEKAKDGQKLLGDS